MHKTQWNGFGSMYLFTFYQLTDWFSVHSFFRLLSACHRNYSTHDDYEPKGVAKQPYFFPTIFQFNLRGQNKNAWRERIVCLKADNFVLLIWRFYFCCCLRNLHKKASIEVKSLNYIWTALKNAIEWQMWKNGLANGVTTVHTQKNIVNCERESLLFGANWISIPGPFG